MKKVSAERLASLWYGPLPLAEVAKLLDCSETRVRYEAVIVHKLGCRTAEGRAFWAAREAAEHRRKIARAAR